MRLLLVFFAVLVAIFSCVNILLQVQYETHEKGVIVLTGASTGIGRHSVLDLASSGYTVFAGIRSQKDIANLEEEATTSKLPNLKPILLDVTREDHIENVLEEVNKYISQTNEPFVGLVNNAGIADFCPFETIPVDYAQKTFNVNYWGMFKITQKFLPLIRKHKARVVSVSSALGLMAVPGTSIYSGTKFAMEATMDSLRRELGPHGCSVSLIEPGFIRTPILSRPSYCKEIATEEHKKLYAKILKPEILSDAVSIPGPEVTSAAIKHALVDPYPQTRYPLSGFGLPTSVLVVLTSILPDRAMDFVVQNL